MAARIALFEIEPDLMRFLSQTEQEIAVRLRVPLIALPAGELNLDEMLDHHEAFGALVVEGMLLAHVRIGDHSTLRILGPGDLVGPIGGADSVVAASRAWTAAADCRVALLGMDFLSAARHWPALIAGLHVRSSEQAERAAVQLAVGHLPRVEDRLLAILWWLAEIWGRVTAQGTLVPLALTHDILGALIGARRPTVTLALRELSERGAVLRQDAGWLLIEPPPEAPARPLPRDVPAIIDAVNGKWQVPTTTKDREQIHAALHETVERLRREHDVATAAMRERMEALRVTRERIARRRLARERPRDGS